MAGRTSSARANAALALGAVSLVAAVAVPQSYYEITGEQCEFHRSSQDGDRGGVFTSPGFTSGGYPEDSKCTYSFRSVGKQRVQIVFDQFNLYLPPQDRTRYVNGTLTRCKGDQDHMTAYVMIGNRLSEIDTFCGGAEMPPQLMSSEQYLTLDFVFKSKTAQRSPGAAYRYKFNYRFVSNYGIDGLTPDPKHPCGFIFNSSRASNGTLYSPNYPGYYPRNTDCHYEFHGAADERVRIHFTYFDVEGFKHCHNDTQSDYIIFSNYQTEDRTNQRFCGGESPLKVQPIVSESNYFRMVFHSNAIFDATGFYASYQFSKPAKAGIKSVQSSNGAGGGGGRGNTRHCAAVIVLVALCSALLWRDVGR